VRFYLLDRITEVVPQKSIRAAKLVSSLDPVLEDHPAVGPVLPSALVLESVNQAIGWIAVVTSDFALRLVPGAWRRITIASPARLGERLEITAQVDNWSEDGIEVSSEVTCRGEVVLRAEGGLFFFVDATEWESPELTRQHHRAIYRDGAPLSEMPPPLPPEAIHQSAVRQAAYPWVPYDVVEALVPGERAVARKSIVMTDSIFVNHFRRTPVAPGVLMIQSMVDLCRALLAAGSGPGVSWQPTMIQRVRFQRRVCPGDILVIEARLTEAGEQRASLACEGRVAGARAISLRSVTFAAEPQVLGPRR
jgi:3-hydroxyacyl-[acyl-carrier-protein] dehydratase